TALSFDHTRMTDSGLQLNRGWSSLRVVDLGMNVYFTDQGIENLQGLTQLEELKLTLTRIYGSSLGHFNGMKNLGKLDLGGTLVDDAGLEHIKGLTELEFLALSSTRVTDAGLAHSAGLTNLK